MTCFRCGARITDTVCPSCGFDLHSPVEIRIPRRMLEVRINGRIISRSANGGDDTVRIDCPERTRVRLSWCGIEYERNMVNGEAYRFLPAGGTNSFRLIKTRRIPKRKRSSRWNPAR